MEMDDSEAVGCCFVPSNSLIYWNTRHPSAVGSGSHARRVLHGLRGDPLRRKPRQDFSRRRRCTIVNDASKYPRTGEDDEVVSAPKNVPTKFVRVPREVFLSSSGIAGVVVAVGACVFTLLKPQAILEFFSYPFLLSISSFFLGCFLAQYSVRTRKLPLVTICLPLIAAAIGFFVGLDSRTVAGFALVAAGPVSFSPVMAMASSEVYLSFTLLLCRITYGLVFLLAPFVTYVGHFLGTGSCSPVFVASTMSLPFLAGIGFLRSLSPRYAALLGRISLYSSWICCLPQLMSLVARLRLGSIPIVHPIEIVVGILVIQLLVFGLATIVGQHLGNDSRLKRTLFVSIASPNGVLCGAVAAHSNMVSPLPCTLSIFVSGVVYFLAARVWRMNSTQRIIQED